MEPRTRLGKTLCYTLLLVGSVLFLFPFVWLVSTSLKPNEQTTTIPPKWIPENHVAEINGEPVQVVHGEAISTPMYVVRVHEGRDAGKKRRVPVTDFEDGRIRVNIAGVTRWYDAELLYKAEKGWRYIERRVDERRIDQAVEWDLVPPESIESDPHLFWSNFPTAVERMGLTTVSVPLLGTFTVPIFWLYMRNTLIVCVLGVLGTVTSSALVGYSLSRIAWKGRGTLFAITLATMMVPFPVLMVPLYTLFKTFGWVGTLLPLWMPAFFGTGFNIFLLRQFFLTIPRDLSEAARIDGCSELGIFWRVILPLSKPALAVVALFHFLFAWNDFMGPLLYLTRKETYTLSLGLQVFRSQQGGTDWSSLMAASTLICLPIIVLFFFTQKTFIKGIATTGLKG